MQQPQSAVRRKLEGLRYLYRHGGIGGVLFSIFYELMNRVTRLVILRPAILETRALLDADLGRLDAYRHGSFNAAELLPFVNDPDIDLSREFLEYATAQGDTCYAIFEGDVLVSYCWNSDQPTLIERDLYMGFRQGYTYRYKEFTRPSHRGRRLSSYNHAESLRCCAASGLRGFAGYVEANNYVSYRMLQRTQHLFAGFIVVLGKGANPWIWHSPAARDGGFRVFNSMPGMQLHGAVATKRTTSI